MHDHWLPPAVQTEVCKPRLIQQTLCRTLFLNIDVNCKWTVLCTLQPSKWPFLLNCMDPNKIWLSDLTHPGFSKGPQATTPVCLYTHEYTENAWQKPFFHIINKLCATRRGNDQMSCILLGWRLNSHICFYSRKFDLNGHFSTDFNDTNTPPFCKSQIMLGNSLAIPATATALYFACSWDCTLGSEWIADVIRGSRDTQ